MYYVNEDIKNCVRVFPEQGRYDYARYDMNENPEGLPQWFVDEVLAEITPEFLATYPEHDKFRKMYADYIGVKPENVAVTNGSDMAIRFAMEVFAEKGSSVVTVTLYSLHEIIRAVQSASHRSGNIPGIFYRLIHLLFTKNPLKWLLFFYQFYSEETARKG